MDDPLIIGFLYILNAALAFFVKVCLQNPLIMYSNQQEFSKVSLMLAWPKYSILSIALKNHYKVSD